MSKPDPKEHAPYFSRYIDLVAEDDIVGALDRQAGEIASLLAGVTEEKAQFRYAPGKWSIKQLVNHITDSERVFVYRALSIARGETKSLPGFDENAFAANADSDRRSIRDLAAEFGAVRAATLALFRSLPEAAWKRMGTANDNPISVGAIAHVVVGHARHHEKILRERYL